jgi:DNA-binding MarR family transcriptional regulator
MINSHQPLAPPDTPNSGQAPTGVEASPEPIDILELASLVIASSRLIGGLANLPLFKNARVSLTEWLALSVLAHKEGASNKILARSLGVTGQRANQLCTSLGEAKLISIKHAEDDSRRNVIEITDTGKKQLDRLNSHLQEIVENGLKGKRRPLTMAGKQMRLMMRIVQAGTPEIATKLPERNGKKKAEIDGVGHGSGKQ